MVIARGQDSVDLRKVWAFDALQILSFVLNVLIFGTAMISSRVKRAPIWFMFMSGWILWAVGFALLLLSGRQVGDDPPPQALCLFQAGLVYAFPPYMVFLNLGLVAHVYLVIRATIGHLRPRTQTPLIFILLPIVVFLGPFIGVLVVGLQDPTVIERKTMLYCNATDRISFKISAALCALGALSTVGLEVALGVTLYRNWQAYQIIRQLPGNATIVCRLFVFGIAPALALVFNILSEIYPTFDYLSIMMLHSLPTIAAFIFGTHRDILQVWCCFSGRRTGLKVGQNPYPRHVFPHGQNASHSHLMSTNPSDREKVESDVHPVIVISASSR